MIDDLKAIAVFAEMARQGSFRAAADALGLSPSVVSYHVSQLEKRVGTALIYRSTRKLSLTHEGQVLYQHARTMLDAAQQGLNEVVSHDNEPQGKLTITLPSALTRAPINQRIAEFAKQYPKIELNLLYTDIRQDLIANGIDLAVRAGELEDSALKSKSIGTIERVLVCSASYAEQHDAPSVPEDLAEWNWIRLAMLPTQRTLIGPANQRIPIHYASQIVVDSVDAMAQFSILGLGISTPPRFLVEDAIADGRLVQLLSEWHVEGVPIYAVWPGNASINNNARRLLNYLTPTTES